MGRKGDWTGTYAGIRFWVLDPKPEEVDINDIVYPLSRICRFNGHTKYFYSVAQHCINVAKLLKRQDCSPLVQLYGLLHDAGEAYFCDMPKPIKGYIPTYKDIEGRLERAILQKFGLEEPSLVMHAMVKEADNLMLTNESQALMQNIDDWPLIPVSENTEVAIHRVPSFLVRWQFKRMLKRLMREVVPDVSI